MSDSVPIGDGYISDAARVAFAKSEMVQIADAAVKLAHTERWETLTEFSKNIKLVAHCYKQVMDTVKEVNES